MTDRVLGIEFLTSEAPSTTRRIPTSTPLVVTIGILTYQRPVTLLTTLRSLQHAVDRHPAAPAWQLREIVVIDNDAVPSARSAVDELISDGFPQRLRYVHESTPGLAAARNRALDEADGDVLVFIDDDETAEPGWPGGLIDVMAGTGAALVGGPVRTTFTETPPSWIARGGFFDRAEPANGSLQTWLRSGNLAIDLAQIGRVGPDGLRFDDCFGRSGGEDVHFTRSAAREGLELRWSSTAIVTEAVGPERTRLRWLTNRERRSTATWVRVELLHNGSFSTKGLVVARAMVRLGQGLLTTLVGAASLQSARVGRGLVLIARGIGSLEGLVGRNHSTYG